MPSRRMFADIRKFDVQGEHHPPFFSRSLPQLCIGFTHEPFVLGRRRVVPKLLKDGFEMTRQVLVQLDFHEAVTFQTCSRASSAP